MLAGIDRSDLGSVALDGLPAKPAPTNAAALEPICGTSASNDLVLSVSVSRTVTNEPISTLVVKWMFKISSAWGEVVDVPGTVSINAGVRVTVGPTQLKYSGSQGVEYSALADLRVVSQTNDAHGVCSVTPVYYFNEETFPMRLEKTPTGIRGLDLHRVAYARTEGNTRSLLTLVADSIGKLSKHVCIADTNPEFRWDTGWFSPLGERVLSNVNTADGSVPVR